MGALSGFLSGFGKTFPSSIQGAGSAYAKSRHLTKQRQEDRKQLLEDRETKKYEDMTKEIIRIGKNPKDFLGTPEEIYKQMEGALGAWYKNEPERKRKEILLLQANKEGFRGEDAIEKWEASMAEKRTFEENLRKTQQTKADLDIWNLENPNIAKDYSEAVTAGFTNAYQKTKGGIGWERSDSYSEWEDLKRQITTEKLNKSKARPEDKAALINLVQTYQRYRNQTLATDDDGKFTVSAQAVSQLDLIGSKIQYAYDKLSDPKGGINFSKQLDVISNAILKYGSSANDPSIEKGGNVSGSPADKTYGSVDARNNLIDFAFMLPKNNTTPKSVDEAPSNGLGGNGQPRTLGENVGIEQQDTTTDSMNANTAEDSMKKVDLATLRREEEKQNYKPPSGDVIAPKNNESLQAYKVRMTSIANSAREAGDKETIQKIYKITIDENIWGAFGNQEVTYADTTKKKK